MSLMSSSVMVARTRMWRMMVAAARGGSLVGATWQRLQFAWKRFSPSMRRDGSTWIAEVFELVAVSDFGVVFVDAAGAGVEAAGVAVDAEFTTDCSCAAATNVSTTVAAIKNASARLFRISASPRVPREGRSDM